jgi:hypothetical protein
LSRSRLAFQGVGSMLSIETGYNAGLGHGAVRRYRHIQRELPRLMAQEPQVREFILRTVSDYYAGRQETDSKFDRVLAELQEQDFAPPP